MNRKRRFYIWLVVLTGLWLLSNWPTPIKLGLMHTAGFPFEFAFWIGKDLESFSGLAFLADLAVLVALIRVAWLWAGSRRNDPPTTIHSAKDTVTVHDAVSDAHLRDGSMAITEKRPVRPNAESLTDNTRYSL
jgi:hypothetical protein